MRNTRDLRGLAARMVRIGAVVGTAAAMMLTAACGTATQGSGSQVNVVVSINQWKSLAEQIGGDKVSVTSILSNQNVEAHDFEPQPSDIAKISKAQIVLANGADYDAWATKSAQNSGVAVVNAADAAKIESGGNPHVWFSSAARKATAAEFLAQLKKVAADEASYFDARYAAWEKDEAALESAIADVRAKTEGLSYAATESVAYYLAEDLGMKDATPTGYAQATENESEPAPGDIKTFQEKLEEGALSLLVVNDQETNSTTAMISQAAKKGGVPIVHLTESMPSEYSDVVTWVEVLVKEFQAALK